MAPIAKLYVDSHGKAGDVQFPLALAGATVTITAGAPTPGPRRTDPKADWVAFAISVGADPGEAAAATKDELIETYGNNARVDLDVEVVEPPGD